MFPEVDSYLGSGKALNNAINKYGKECFERKYLVTTPLEEYAYELERLYVDEDFIKSPDNYNINIGGKAPPKRTGCTSWNKGLTKETDDRIAKVAAGKVGKLKGPRTTETKNKISEGNLGKTRTKEMRETYSKAQLALNKVTSEETRNKISVANTGNTAWNKGKTLSKKHACQNRQRAVGRKHYTNGDTNKMCYPDTQPEGYYLGRTLNSHKEKRNEKHD